MKTRVQLEGRVEVLERARVVLRGRRTAQRWKDLEAMKVEVVGALRVVAEQSRSFRALVNEVRAKWVEAGFSLELAPPLPTVSFPLPDPLPTGRGDFRTPLERSLAAVAELEAKA